MYRKYILRGAISFFVAGIAFTLMQPICRLIGVWAKIVLSSAALGAIGGYYLGSYSDDADRVMYYAAAGFAIGGVVFFLLGGRAFDAIVNAVIAGFIGGAGLGLGWRDRRSAIYIGVVCAVLTPLAFYLNHHIIDYVFGSGIQVSGLFKILTFALLALVVPYLGFAVLGGSIGAILAYLDSKAQV